MGEVPVLEHGELRLTQSGVILDYLAQRYRDFAPGSEEERREVLRWTLWDNHKLTGSVATAALPDEVRARGEARPERHRLPRQARRPRAEGPRPPPLRPGVGRRRPRPPPTSPASATSTSTTSSATTSTAYPNIERWRQAIAALPGWKHPYDLMPGHPIPAGRLT